MGFNQSDLMHIFCTFLTYGSFTLTDRPHMNSDSDSKPDGHIVLCRTFHIAKTQTQIPIESKSESVSGNVNEPLDSVFCSPLLAENGTMAVSLDTVREKSVFDSAILFSAFSDGLKKCKPAFSLCSLMWTYNPSRAASNG